MSKAEKGYGFSIRDIKRRSRKVVKSHYWFLFITCIFAAFLGSEFTDAILLTSSNAANLHGMVEVPDIVVEGSQQVFGQSEGVFAAVFTGVASGSIFDWMFNGISLMVRTGLVASFIYIGLALLMVFGFWFLISNMYIVVSRRIFLESRIYKRVSVQKFLFLFYIKKWRHVSWVMFVTSIYNFFWYFALVVPGIMKRYSYFMVPFILAENPKVSAREAIALSRKMMTGHKFECFLLELSFFGWLVLRIATMGLSGLFFSNSYQVAAYTEFYVYMRTLAKQGEILGSELLNDKYLYEKADQMTLDESYIEVVSILNSKRTKMESPKTFGEKILDFLGITLHREEEEEQRQIKVIRENGAKEYQAIIDGQEYPLRLFTIAGRAKNAKNETVNYMRKYTIPSLIMIFFVFCFIGWIWEVVLRLVNEGRFVNRGMLRGPWLPIYGSGGVLILTCLYRLRRKAWMQFASAVVMAGLVEYFTSYALEMAHGEKWWDYSGYFINIHGRICGEGLMVFGMGAIAGVYILAPLIDDYVSKVRVKILVVVSCVLIAVFAVDATYSLMNPNMGSGITVSSIETEMLRRWHFGSEDK